MNLLYRPRVTRLAPLLFAAAALILIGLIGPASSSAAVYFKNRTDFTTEKFPDSVAIGDLNGDGIPDLVVTNWGADTVSILLGTGHGNYEPQTSFPSGGRPDGVVIHDFNGDGKPDLAVSSETDNAVSIMLGTGTGSFGAPTSFSVGLYPRALVLGDFNGDGKPDLAVVSSGSQSISILLGNGAGSLSLKGTLSTGRTPYSLAIGDFNGDGKLDLAVVNYSENNLGVYLGAGNGTFGAATNFATGSYPQALAIGDFNGDGKADLAVANQGSANVSVLLGTGTGSFEPQATYATESTPTSIGVGDLDGDGNPDIVVGNQGASSISVLLGNGAGGFAAQSVFGVLYAPAALAVGDLDGDGKPDLAVVNESAGRGSVLLSGKAVPTISTSASSPIALGAQISDSATVSEGSLPSGTVTFTAYGPDDATCSSTPANTSTAAISGNGTVNSTSFTPTAPGTYRFIAAYSGDSHNEGVSGACNDAGESVTVGKAATGISTEASGSVALGGSIGDEATLRGGSSPTGSIVFEAYGPGDATCTAAPVFTSSPVTVSGSGGYSSPTFVPSASGTYRWIAGYSGDSQNEAVAGACNDADESVAVGRAASFTTLAVSPNPAPLGGSVTLTAKVTGAAPTGTVTFTDGTTTLGTAPLGADGTAGFATTGLAVGAHQLSAAYAGDADNLPSSSEDLGEAITAPPAEPLVAHPVAPQVRISYSPNHPHAPNPKRGPRYTFHFADQAAGTTFYCRIDKEPFTPCHSPAVYRGLARGRHVFAVKSVDTGGAESATQSVRFFAGRRRR